MSRTPGALAALVLAGLVLGSADRAIAEPAGDEAALVPFSYAEQACSKEETWKFSQKIPAK